MQEMINMTCRGRDVTGGRTGIALAWSSTSCVIKAKVGRYYWVGHLTCLLRNLYAGQEALVRTGCGTTDGFK